MHTHQHTHIYRFAHIHAYLLGGFAGLQTSWRETEQHRLNGLRGSTAVDRCLPSWKLSARTLQGTKGTSLAPRITTMGPFRGEGCCWGGDHHLSCSPPGSDKGRDRVRLGGPIGREERQQASLYVTDQPFHFQVGGPCYFCTHHRAWGSVTTAFGTPPSGTFWAPRVQCSSPVRSKLCLHGQSLQGGCSKASQGAICGSGGRCSQIKGGRRWVRDSSCP